MTEDNSWDVLIVHLGVWLVVKDTMGQFASSSNSHWEREGEGGRGAVLLILDILLSYRTG